MKKLYDVDSLEELAYQYANELKKLVKLNLDLNNGDDFRRDLDGVSSEEFLFFKLIGEILKEGRPNVKGLIQCQDEDPTPWCSYGHKTREKCDCGPIADND